MVITIPVANLVCPWFASMYCGLRMVIGHTRLTHYCTPHLVSTSTHSTLPQLIVPIQTMGVCQVGRSHLYILSSITYLHLGSNRPGGAMGYRGICRHHFLLVQCFIIETYMHSAESIPCILTTKRKSAGENMPFMFEIKMSF